MALLWGDRLAAFAVPSGAAVGRFSLRSQHDLGE